MIRSIDAATRRHKLPHAQGVRCRGTKILCTDSVSADTLARRIQNSTETVPTNDFCSFNVVTPIVLLQKEPSRPLQRTVSETVRCNGFEGSICSKTIGFTTYKLQKPFVRTVSVEFRSKTFSFAIREGFLCKLSSYA